MSAAAASAVRAVCESEAHVVTRLDDGPALRPRVAVLPSAFNPPTEAHVSLLATAAQTEGVASVAALLSTRNVDKGLYGATLEHRAGMLLALHEWNPWLAILVSNAARIMDQAAALRRAYPAVDFDFIVGFDTLVRVFDPGYYSDMWDELRPFFRHHRLIATNRGSVSSHDVYRYLETPDIREVSDRIVVCSIDEDHASVSSSDQRRAIEAGTEPESLPAPVAEYIRAHDLYARGEGTIT